MIARLSDIFGLDLSLDLRLLGVFGLGVSLFSFTHLVFGFLDLFSLL